MNPELEKHLFSRVASIDEELTHVTIPEYTSNVYHHMHLGPDGLAIMDVAASVGNTAHDPTLRQAVYSYGFTIGLELFAHGISDQHHKDFMLELKMIQHVFDKAQQPGATQDDIDVSIALSQQAYEAYEAKKKAVHHITDKIWGYLDTGQGRVSDFETAIGIISMAVDNSRPDPESDDTEPYDLFKLFSEPLEKETRLQKIEISAPVDLEVAREIIFRSFVNSPHVKRLRDTNVLDRVGLIEGLGKAIDNLNTGPVDLPFMAKGTDMSVMGGSFYMIYDITEHTTTYHVLPDDWQLFGVFDRFARGDIPLESEMKAMQGRTRIEEFTDTIPAGLFMKLIKPSLNYGTTSNMEMSEFHEVYIPMNYALKGTLFSPPTVQ